MKYSLLLVDDHKMFIDGITNFVMQEFDFDLDSALNGEEAFKKFKKGHYHIVVTGIEMPVMDGIELTKKIKEFKPETKVIILSMMNRFDIAVAALRAGADDYIVKNRTKEEFLESIKKTIEKITTDKYSINVDIPRGLITTFQQYLLYFRKYICYSKNIILDYEVNAFKHGLEIKIGVKPDFDIDKLQNWLREYLGFLGQNIEKLVVEFEFETSTRNADLLIADLKNQIAHLKNSLEIEKIRNNLIQTENDFLKKLCLQITGQPKKIARETIGKKEELKELIAKGKSSKVIELILPIFKENNEVYNQIIILNNQISQVELEKRIGIADNRNELIQMGRINKAILEIIDKIEGEIQDAR